MVVQWPPVHVSPALHALLLQHAWLEPPHGGGVSHVPLVHANPAAHRLPEQHACRAAPHATGATH